FIVTDCKCEAGECTCTEEPFDNGKPGQVPTGKYWLTTKGPRLNMSTKAFDSVTTGNLLSKAEPHAAALEACAAPMEADGIGGDIHSGHVSVLRRMAAQLRSEAATGRLAHSYHASAEPARLNPATTAILNALR